VSCGSRESGRKGALSHPHASEEEIHSLLLYPTPEALARQRAAPSVALFLGTLSAGLV
jgi:hypothetical protein